MDIKETANNLIDKAKTALDADADGKVEASEVLDALSDRVLETAEAAAVAADEIKQGFDADADGKVSLDEVKVVADGVAAKAKEAVNGITEKFSK
jgi:Ca2+-binding EF-hand superfamily protein